MSGLRASPDVKTAYFPRSEGTVTWLNDESFQLPIRPHSVGPIDDPRSLTEPLHPFDEKVFNTSFVERGTNDGTSAISPTPVEYQETGSYLSPMLTRNERLRLTMLWYYTRDLDNDPELLRRLQDKVNLVQVLTGWDFAICGVLDNHVFTRLVTAGLPLAVLPRRESTCSHTVQQTPGSVFVVANMDQDWRFKASPPVKKGGLKSYAGTQLRCRTEDGQDVALGSLCVASTTPGLSLSLPQQNALVRFADMLTADLVSHSRENRQRQRLRMKELITTAASQTSIEETEASVMGVLKTVYPGANVSVQDVQNNRITLENGTTILLVDVVNGLWEDGDYIDSVIASNNQEQLSSTVVVRAIVSKFLSKRLTKVLAVASKDIQLVFDDLDSWFVDSCATLLNSAAQERSLRDALHAKEQFLRGITHQLRTPIHGVLGSVDLLTEELGMKGLLNFNSQMTEYRGLSGPIDAGEILRTIRNSGRELMSTVNNMIKLNRWADLSSSPPKPELCDPLLLEVNLYEDAISMMPDDDVGLVSVFFVNRLAAESASVTVDAAFVKDCLQSLVLNAIQNTANGSVVITISAVDDYSTLRIDVEDTGCGISDQDQTRIFGAYEKADALSRGAGLGLTLANKIASSMDGSVSLVSSTIGKGSHFRAEFRNLSFACPMTSQNRPRSPKIHAIPPKFCIIPTDLPADAIEPFVRFLESRGIGKADDPSDMLAIINLAPETSMDFLGKLLRDANGARISVCLLPTDKSVEKYAKQHPKILFLAGPYTTTRLDDILEAINEALEKSAQSEESLIPLSNETNKAGPLRQRNHRRNGTSSSVHHSPAPKKKAPRCLLVDDNLINLRIIRMYCEKRSLYYQTAMNGEQAVEKYKLAADGDSPLTLVLLDLQMPICDGIEACAEIREFEKDREMTPAIIFMITGQDSRSDREASFAAGADDFFVKPMSMKTLDFGVAQHFESSGK